MALLACSSGNTALSLMTPWPDATSSTVSAFTPAVSGAANMGMALLTSEDVGQGWSRTSITESDASMFLDPCDREPWTTKAASFKHLRKQKEPATTPEITQQIGLLADKAASGFIRGMMARCDHLQSIPANYEDEAAIFATVFGEPPASSTHEYVVLIRSGNWIMVLDVFSGSGRDKLPREELDGLTDVAASRFGDFAATLLD
jgi:hypothetical protein